MKVVNTRTHKATTKDVDIGRPNALGNPFIIGRDGTREQVITKYEEWVRRQPKLLVLIHALPEDAILRCWCKPLACHGDVITKLWKEMHQ
jgi:hypothetical protein